MKRFDMAFPQTVGDACTLLAENPDSRVIAGGTALTVVMKEGVYAPELLVNIRGLEDELRYVHETDDEIRIGALSTLRRIERSDVVREHVPTVTDCLAEIAGVRVRNAATIGGHLAHADVNLDLPPVLAGLDSVLVLSRGDDTRTIPLEDFLVGYYETELAADELITEVRIPKPESGTRGTYVKHRYFSEVDWPCVGVAAFAVRDGDGYRNVRVLLNSVSATSVLRVEGVTEAVSPSLTEDEIEAVGELAEEQSTPTGGIRGSAPYKRRMARVFTERALRRLKAPRQ